MTTEQGKNQAAEKSDPKSQGNGAPLLPSAAAEAPKAKPMTVQPTAAPGRVIACHRCGCTSCPRIGQDRNVKGFVRYRRCSKCNGVFKTIVRPGKKTEEWLG